MTDRLKMMVNQTDTISMVKCFLYEMKTSLASLSSFFKLIRQFIHSFKVKRLKRVELFLFNLAIS